MSSGRNAETTEVRDVDQLADLQVDRDAADRVGLLPGAAVRSSQRWSIMCEQRVARRQGQVLGPVLAVAVTDMPVVA